MPDPIGVHPKSQLEKRIDDLEGRCSGGGGVGEYIQSNDYYKYYTERFNDYRPYDSETGTGGNYSTYAADHIEGYNNHAITLNRYAMGKNHFEGENNTAGQGLYSCHLEGSDNVLEYVPQGSEFYQVHVEGYKNKVKNGGYALHVGGKENTAERYCRHTIILGEGNKVENVEGSAIFGRYNEVSASILNGSIPSNTLVAGSYNDVSNHDCAVFGNNNKCSKSYSLVSGMGADDEATYYLTIGNGGNIMTLDGMGNLTITGRYIGSGADYAEYFEWLDGNPESEDRCGMLVVLDGDKLIPAHGDEIFGIISAAPSVVGNAYELHWSGKYARDIFGRIITTPDGEPLISPDYDPNRKYIPRSKRPEWAAVGMTGRLVINDDGSCKPGGYVSARRGVGTSCYKNTGIRVLRRIDERHVEVIIR